MYRTILLPIDISAPSTWAHALPAALRLGGDDIVLHVVTVLPDFGLSVVGSFFDKGFEDRAMREVGQKLREWVDANIPDGVEVHPHVMHGRVYDEILRAADKLAVEAIVLAAQSPPDVADYLLGPNAARVVRHSRKSVFVVRGG